MWHYLGREKLRCAKCHKITQLRRHGQARRYISALCRNRDCELYNKRKHTQEYPY